MDEVDRHILSYCRQLECSFVDNEDFSVGGLSTEECFEFLIRSLWSIDNDCRVDLPVYSLPPSINKRFQVATKVAELLKKYKIRGDFGYQTLLYGNIKELRNIFISVIEKVPRDNVIEETETDATSSLLHSASGALPDSLWVPEFCRRLKLKHDGRFWCPREGSADLFSFLSSRSDLWSSVNSDESRSWMAALIRSNEQEKTIQNLLLSQKPPIAEKPRVKPVLPPKPSNLSTEDGLLEAELEEKRAKLALILERQEERRKQIIRTHYDKKGVENSLSSLKEIDKQERLVQLLRDPVDGRQKILDFLQESSDRMEELEENWATTHREKLEELQRLREAKGMEGRTHRLKERIDKSKARSIELKEHREADEKMEHKLESRLSRIGDNSIQRDAITKRIMEMTMSLRKQKDELDKILSDNAIVQKEMKWSSQTLYRTFNIIEETLFKDTDNYKGEQAYRVFGKTNALCNESMQMIEQNGIVARNIEQLTDQLEIENQKQFVSQLSRIRADIREVDEENKQLEEKLRLKE